MVIPFATATEISADFETTFFLFAFIILAITLLIAFIPQEYQVRQRLRILPAVLFAACVFPCLLWINYSTTFGRFISANVNHSEIRLQYAGPFARDVVLPRDTVTGVLFGLPGKYGGKCYVNIQQRSGANYRSATTNATAGACKDIRSKIMSDPGA